MELSPKKSGIQWETNKQAIPEGFPLKFAWIQRKIVYRTFLDRFPLNNKQQKNWIGERTKLERFSGETADSRIRSLISNSLEFNLKLTFYVKFCLFSPFCFENKRK